MKIIDIDNRKIGVGGRVTECREPLSLVWTGSYVEFNVKASEFRVLLAGPYTTYENWIAIEINGEVVSRRMVEKQKEWITVFRMKDPETVTNVKIIKEVQAFSGDTEHRLDFYEIETDGELLAVRDRAFRIEFIGDSITSAEGCVGAKSEMEWIAGVFSHINSYPYFTGKRLDADIRVFSQSGWGVYSSWDCNPEGAIPKYYEHTASVMNGEFFEKNGFHNKNDFSKWQPDVIVINLGTNDDGAFHNNECDNADLLRMSDDKYVEEDRLNVKGAMVSFLKILRNNNPDAYIIWAYGMIGDMLEPTILEAIEEYKAQYHDSIIKYIKLPEVTEKNMGARNHPGRKAHKEVTKVLVKALKEYLY